MEKIQLGRHTIGELLLNAIKNIENKKYGIALHNITAAFNYLQKVRVTYQVVEIAENINFEFPYLVFASKTSLDFCHEIICMDLPKEFFTLNFLPKHRQTPEQKRHDRMAKALRAVLIYHAAMGFSTARDYLRKKFDVDVYNPFNPLEDDDE